MLPGNSIKLIGIYHLIFILITLASCISNSDMELMHNNENFYGIPELLQQEISAEISVNHEEYGFYSSRIDKGPIIPGIFQSAVPQGMAYYDETDLMIISNYMFDGRPSCLTVVNMSDGLLKKTLWLLNPDGSPHKGHVGGLAVSNKFLWIASGKGAYYISLDSFNNLTDNSNLKMTAFVPSAAKGSFATFSDGILWIGEFTSRDGSYSVPTSHHYETLNGSLNHAWLTGFVLNNVSDLINQENLIAGINYPDYILSIPHEVQGAVFTNNNIYLSQSYGRKNNSRISVYTNPLEGPPYNKFIIKEDLTVPVWILGKDNLIIEIKSPPMTEGIVAYKGAIAVLFESGSDKYRSTAKNPQDRIDILSVISDF